MGETDQCKSQCPIPWSARPRAGCQVALRMTLICPGGEGYWFRDAIKAEEEKHYMDAARLYAEGAERLYEQARKEPNRDSAVAFVKLCAPKYEKRARQMEHKAAIVKDRSMGLTRRIDIQEDEKGYGLEKVLLDYADKKMIELEIDDLNMDMEIFSSFYCSLLKCAPDVKTIHVKYKPLPDGSPNFDAANAELLDRGVTLELERDDDLDHSEVRMNGWIFEMEHGLNYFKHYSYRPDPDNLDYRECRATTITISPDKDPSGDKSSDL